jgi:hypothetical protein
MDGAKRRAHEFSITPDYLDLLWETQQGRCALTGWSIGFNGRVKGHTASLDRIDSSLGYIEGNLQWVHRNVNRAKNVSSQDDFVRMCQAVVGHVSAVTLDT